MRKSGLKSAARLFACALFGFAVFVGTMYLELGLLPVTVKMRPRTDPMQDGIGLVRWDLLGGIAAFVAVASAMALYLWLRRRGRGAADRAADVGMSKWAILDLNQ